MNKSIKTTLSIAAIAGLALTGAAHATVLIDFESYSLGSIDG
ncbi:hypothetical protein [Rubritalea profundi]|nr:hypothetical protein [Rubritalea profundi]